MSRTSHPFLRRILPLVLLSFVLAACGAATADVSNGLVAHYTFDGSSSNVLADSSGNGYDGTIHGATSVAGKVDGAYDFDGVNDYVDVDPLVAALASNTTGTVAFWAKMDPDDDVEHAVLSVSRDADSTRSDFLVSLDWRRDLDFLYARLTVDGEIQWMGNGPEGMLDGLAGQWLHVAVTHDGVRPVLYMNGSHVSTTFLEDRGLGKWFRSILVDAGSAADSANIGLVEVGSTDYLHFGGAIDDLRIYDRALASNEVAELATPAMGDGLVLHYTFDEYNGTSIADESGTGNTGAVHGATFASNGVMGGAYQFDGSDDHVQVAPLVTALASSTIGTVAFWAKHDVVAGRENMVFSLSRDADATRTHFAADFDARTGTRNITAGFYLDGVLRWAARTGVGTLDTYRGRWMHMAVVQDGVSPVLYLDGQVAQVTFTPDIDRTLWFSALFSGTYPADSANIGMLASEGLDRLPYRGSVDDLRIYDRPLSSNQVAQLYQAASSDLVGLWVGGDPGTYGTSSPYGYGSNTVVSGTVVTESVPGHVRGPTGTRYVCTGWQGTGDVPAEGSSNSVAFTATQDSSLIWQWRTDYLVELVAGVNGSLDNPGGWLPAGTTCVATATASNGYVFAGWTGDVPAGSETNNPLGLVVDQPRSLAATFSPAPVDLVLHYTFDDYNGIGVADESGTGNTGAVYGATFVSNGVIGGAYFFDGVDDYVDCGGDTSLQITGALTYSAWMQATNSGQWGVIVARRNTNDPAHVASDAFYTDSGKFSMGICDGTPVQAALVTSGQTVGDGRWHHVVGVFAPGASLTVYVDGEQEGRRTNGILASLNPAFLPVYIGRENASSGHFRGSLDDVRIYSGAMNAGEVRQLFDDAGYDPSGLDEHLVAHYTFDDSDSSTLYDRSGNGNDGTIHGATQVVGRIGGAYDFDDVNDYVDVDPLVAALVSNATGTIAFWARMGPDDGVEHAVFSVSREADSTRSDFHVSLDWRRDLNFLYARLTVDGEIQWMGTGPEGMLDGLAGQWLHVAVTHDGVRPVLYMNGSLVSTTFLEDRGLGKWFRSILVDAGLAADSANIGMIEVGSTDHQHFGGSIDDLRIYDRALSSSQVAQLYQAASSDFVGLWVGADPEPRGTPTPYGYGSNWIASGTVVTESVPSPVSGGTGTQYVCGGWLGAGDVPASGRGNSVTFTLTQQSGVIWQWQTEHLVQFAAGADGSVDTAGGWYAAGSTAVVSAIPSNGYVFAGWTGDVPAGSETDNPLHLTVDRTRTVVATFSPVSPVGDLVLHYTFDTHDGMTVPDESGTGNDGDVRGTMSSADSVIYGAYVLDGVDDHVGCGLDPSLQITGDLTYAAWVRKTGDGQAVVIGRRNGNDAYHIASHLSANTVGGATFGICSGAWEPAQAVVTDGLNLNDGQWHHLAGVYEAGAALRIYVDGALSGQATDSIFPSLSNRLLPVYVGSRANAYYFGGVIDDARIYKRALNGSEIAALYNLAAAGKTSVVVAGHPAEYGMPTPLGYGTNWVVSGETVSNAVASPAAGDSGIRHRCMGWTGNGDVPAHGRTNVVTFTATRESALTWSWETDFRLDVQAQGGGTVDVGEAWYATGTVVVLTPSPAPGFAFTGWEGDIPDGHEQDDPLLLTLDQPRSVTAVFTALGLSTGLQLHYTFDSDQGAVVLDSSGNGHHGVLKGAQAVQGVTGGAYDFDGTTHIDGGTNSLGNTDMTLSMWVRTETVDPAYVFGGWNPDGPFTQFTVSVSPGKVNMYSSKTLARIDSSTMINDGLWHHIAYQDIGPEMRIYVDGELEATGDAGSVTYDNWWWSIGTCGGTHTFVGAIDEVRLYDRALSIEEVRKLRVQTLSPGMVLHYTFEDFDGTNVLDRSGMANHGMVHGPVRAADGINGSAYAFDGVDDYIDCGGDASLQITSNVTYCAWVRTSNTHPKGQVIVGRRTGDTAYQIGSHLSQSSSGPAHFGVCSDFFEPARTTASWGYPINDGAWHHVAGTYEANTAVTIYVDGVRRGQNTTNVFPSLNARVLPVYVGRKNANEAHFSGVIDDVQIYASALSPNEVSSVYESGMSARHAKLTVAGNPAEYGAPGGLGYGDHWLPQGTVTSNSVATPVSGGTGIQHVCTGWAGTGDVAATGSTSQAVFTLNRDSSLTWQWRTDYYLDTDGGAYGTVDVGDGWHTNDSVVTVTAAPDTGYDFAGWVGDVPAVSSASNPVTLTMDRPRTITATYDQAWPWPSGGVVLTDRRPTLMWQPTAGATWYRLWIDKDDTTWLDRWLKQTVNTWMPASDMPAGDYTWWVQPWTPVGGSGAWSAGSTFTVASMVPGKTTPLAPIGTVSTGLPEFVWQEVDYATWYYLWLNRADSKASAWWIGGDTNTTPATPLSYGKYDWWVRTWSPDGYGPWSGKASFDYGVTVPLSPTGLLIGTRAPEFSWTGIADAAWYQVLVNRNGAGDRSKWVKGSTNHTFAADFLYGNYGWSVRGWSAPGGYGPWSTEAKFDIGKAVPVSASSTRIRWDDRSSADASWYRFWIQRGSTPQGDLWVRQTDTIAAGNERYIDLATALSAGTYKVWVQTWNATDGYSPWSEDLELVVP